ncbi:MAG: M48 family metalloprotease [Cryobacterium sp.]|nr:M48 family metalloprotease [Oligoflexia bacterium]
MDATQQAFIRRLRNQWSNVLLFGSMILLTSAGLAAGAALGVTFAGRLPAVFPAFKLAFVLVGILGGFSGGVFLSLLVSPFTLRHAFFARAIGEWNGVSLYAAADSDLPGKLPNVFVSGFSFGRGIFRPVIFASEGALKLLAPSALEAVFAHELSHLNQNHLLKRMLRAIGTFIVASVLTAATLIGMHWSGYANLGGAFSLVAGIIPALLTWMTMRQLLWDQEFEADETAMKIFQIKATSLLEALTTLQAAIERSTGSKAHPLVSERILRLEQLAKVKKLPTVELQAA